MLLYEVFLLIFIVLAILINIYHLFINNIEFMNLFLNIFLETNHKNCTNINNHFVIDKLYYSEITITILNNNIFYFVILLLTASYI